MFVGEAATVEPKPEPKVEPKPKPPKKPPKPEPVATAVEPSDARREVISRLMKTSGAVSEGFIDEVSDALAKVPASVLEKYEKHGGIVHVGDKVTTVRPYLKGQTPRGWPPGSTWDCADGAYSHREVVVAEYVDSMYSGDTSRAARVPGVTLHEFGHGFDEAMNDISGDKKSAFFQAYDKEAAEIEKDGELANKMAYYIQSAYGSRKPGASEAFAEGFAVLHDVGAGGQRMKELFLRHFPQTLKELEKIISNLPKK